MAQLVLKDDLTRALVERVSTLVMRDTGVQLGANQQAMVFFRMKKRMIDLGMEDPKDYLEHLEENLESECPILVSLMTTHHTYFFREFTQFEHFERECLPYTIQKLRAENRNCIRVWSAACSRGQEVYSLAMFLEFTLKNLAPDFTYEILGTDVDPESVKIAENGVYRWDEIKEVPSTYLQDFWARGTGDIADFVKVKKPLKSKCRFEPANLFELGRRNTDQKFDIIFCRNVFIYFNPSQIKDCVTSLARFIQPYGRFYIGLSESLNGLDLPLKLSGPSTYVLQSAQPEVGRETRTSSRTSAAVSTSGTKAPASAAPALIRVLCVDDSPTVITLLKKILSKEAGFEVVATAVNGLEAEAALQKQSFDVITLDIHMPERNGIQFLEAMQGQKLPPVVVVSSVSRDDAGTGIRMLELGARDYVEKPSMQELNTRTDEIRMKVKLAAQSVHAKPEHHLSRSFSRNYKISSPEKALRVVVGGFSHRQEFAQLVQRLSEEGDLKVQAPILLLVHGAAAIFDAFAAELTKILGRSVEKRNANSRLELGKVYVDFFSNDLSLGFVPKENRISIMVLGDIPENLVRKIKDLPNPQILVEDLGSYRSPSYVILRLAATRAIPMTSFEFHSNHFLGGGAP